MKILMIGDVVGRPGREILGRLLPGLQEKFKADITIVNAENAAGGLGITREIALDMMTGMGVDVITLGNHAWAKKEIYSFLDENSQILRPANYPPGAPGRGYSIYQTPAGPLAVGVLQGRTFMDPVDDPFREVDNLLESVNKVTHCCVLDFHGEATSEKVAFGWYVDGRVSAVIGTHTHVQTADERILPEGTAYLTDMGMTGPYNSVIGMKCEVVLSRFTTLLPSKFEVADGPARLCGVFLNLNTDNGKAVEIKRINQEG